MLPTGGAGRFSGPLGPGAFRRRIATVEIPAEAAAKLAPHVDALARAEGFPVHGESAMIRSRAMSRTADKRAQHRRDPDPALARPRRGRVERRAPASASSTTCSTCSPATAGSACRSRPSGDLETGAHHTVEDVGIVLGQALDEALGDRAGIRRYGSAAGADGRVAGRVRDRHLRAGRSASSTPTCRPTSIAGFDTELAEEFFRAVANSAKLTLHVSVRYGTNAHHMIEACFKAFARALRVAVSIDPEESGVPSTKGTLSE